MHPTPGATEAPTSPSPTLGEHQAIRTIGLPATPAPWRRIEWTRHAATTLVVPDATAATGVRVVAEFETEEDAAIGEACPDMLAALQALLEHFHTVELSGGHAAVQMARAAVGKALRQPVEPAFKLLSGPLPINLESLAQQRPRRYDVYVLHPSFAGDESHAPAPAAESLGQQSGGA